MNRIEQARAEAAALLIRAYEAAVAAGTLPRAQVSVPQIETPKDPKNGDWASSFPMQNAKVLGLPPRRVAEAVTAAAELNGTSFIALEIAGPGFLNFRLAHGRQWCVSAPAPALRRPDRCKTRTGIPSSARLCLLLAQTEPR